MARLLKNSFWFTTLAGKSGAQLSRHWEKLEPNLAIPNHDFGIIAGAQQKGSLIQNYALSGPSDFTVSLAEAKLNGAKDLLVAPLIHSTMMHQTSTMESTLRFIEHGYFVSESKRKPIKKIACPGEGLSR